MPNVGRPSPGCKTCRDRRIRCDQKRPSCSQCLRAGKECHGYRDPVSLMFKNESHVVAKKAEKRYEELAKSKEPTTPWRRGEPAKTRSMQRMYPVRIPPSAGTIVQPSPNVDARAQGYFLANYAGTADFPQGGQFEWIPQLLSRPDVEGSLRESFRALSLAVFSNAVKSPAVMQKARIAYVSALEETNKALISHETAVKDSTVVSVILLGLYEGTRYTDKSSIARWSKHVSGAYTLFMLRGKSQFDTELGRQIFLQSLGVALFFTLELGTNIPKGVQELYGQIPTGGGFQELGKKFMMSMLYLMHAVVKLNQDNSHAPVDIINKARKLDQDLENIKALLPVAWHPIRVPLNTPSDHYYGNLYSLCLHPVITQMWNYTRFLAIKIHEIIRANLVRLCEEPSSQNFDLASLETCIKYEEDMLRANVAAIIAAVPQITGMVPSPTRPFAPGKDTEESPEEDTMREPGTFINSIVSPRLMQIIQPVYTVGTSMLITDELRQWIIKILHFVALRIGSRQAVVLAAELQEIKEAESTVARDREDIAEWITLGSGVI
ncbi:hypothetical protein ACET3X_008158 [Alternaria dauci]|uniref:Zn(2)-C6 fungal-type domain-containing protein n=1 Tax=Alternaria dauci TaxID=48095 RepID=A0ABR3UC37_9PLEO